MKGKIKRYLMVVLFGFVMTGFAAQSYADTFMINGSAEVAGERETDREIPCSGDPIDVLMGGFSSEDFSNTGLDVDFDEELGCKYSEFRFAVEFPLASIPANCQIDSANLHLRIAAPNNVFGDEIRLSGYKGDGMPMLSLLETPGSLVGKSPEITDFTVVNPTQVYNTLVTSIVDTVYQASVSHVGFVVEQKTLPTNIQMDFFRAGWDGINNANPPLLTVEATCPLTVDIDVKPGSDPNSINLCSMGAIPVAIFGSAEFDVSQIDISTLQLGGVEVKMAGKSGKSLCSVKDTDSDGHDDLVCHFVTLDLGLEDGGAEVSLTGSLEELYGETPFSGSDSVNIVKDDCN